MNSVGEGRILRMLSVVSKSAHSYSGVVLELVPWWGQPKAKDAVCPKCSIHPTKKMREQVI